MGAGGFGGGDQLYGKLTAHQSLARIQKGGQQSVGTIVFTEAALAGAHCFWMGPLESKTPHT